MKPSRNATYSMDMDRPAVEFDHAILCWSIYDIAENGRAVQAGSRLRQLNRAAMAIKNIVVRDREASLSSRSKAADLSWGRDDQDVTNVGKHQGS